MEARKKRFIEEMRLIKSKYAEKYNLCEQETFKKDGVYKSWSFNNSQSIGTASITMHPDYSHCREEARFYSMGFAYGVCEFDGPYPSYAEEYCSKQ